MLASAGRLVEAVLVPLPRWIVPTLVIEALARPIGGVARLLFPQLGFGGERRLRGVLSAARLGARGLRFGRRVTLDGIRNISLGSNVTLYGDVYLGATGDAGKIVIGDDTHIDRQSVVHGQGGVRIGRGCAIAAGVIVYSQTNQYTSDPEAPILEQGTVYKPVEIGDDVWIGAGAVVLPGVTIGDHAVVASGAVVRQDVPEWTIVGGVPAREIGERREKR